MINYRTESFQTDSSDTVPPTAKDVLKPYNNNSFSAEYCFHWVGQGLFCSGTIGDFRFIYDCGGKREFVKKAVNSLAQEWGERQVDLLVLSHLHADHTNGLDLLTEKLTFKRILVPYSDQSMLTCYRLNYERWKELNKKEATQEFVFLEELYESERPSGWFREFFNCRNVIEFGHATDDELEEAGFQKNGKGYCLPLPISFACLQFYQPGFSLKKALEYKKKIGNKCLQDILSDSKLRNSLKQSRLFLNDSSLVMIVKPDCTKSAMDLMLTGDLPETDKRNLEAFNSDTCKLFQVPHHGAHARHHSIINADTNIISCGKNSYGHPSQDTINKYDNTPIRLDAEKSDYSI